MNDSTPDTRLGSAPPPSRSTLVTTVVGGVALAALLGVSVYEYIQIRDLKDNQARQQAALTSEIQALHDMASTLSSNQRQRYAELSANLDRRSREAALATSSVKSAAMNRVEETRKQLEQEQATTAEKINTEVTAVKETANARIAEVSTDVGTVKQQVTSTQTELQKTIASLTKVQGDLGVTSGYVATNGKELSALRRLGERNYFEFTISKGKNPQKVGDIQMVLRKADPKHNRFTLTVMADDKNIEKKDKTANEPVQFYVAQARQPYEIVVNQVHKDQITGYLATPKDHVARGAENN